VPDSYSLHHPSYTQAQADQFVSFWKDDLAHGALSFDMADPLTGLTAVFRFTTAPKWRPIGGSKWALTIPAERMP